MAYVMQMRTGGGRWSRVSDKDEIVVGDRNATLVTLLESRDLKLAKARENGTLHEFRVVDEDTGEVMNYR